VGRTFGGAELPPDSVERGRALIVAVDVAQQTAELIESGTIHAAVLLDTVEGPCAELIEIPRRFCNADHGHIEIAAFHHRMKRRQDLLVREIAARTKKMKASEWRLFTVSWPS
jgi:hypothetical protein